jgi:hypothetical protein
VALPRELFISHSSHDRRVAGRLARVLENHRVPFWYSRKNLQSAQEWHDEIGAALKRCDWFLVMLSPAAVESEWVKRELVYALNDHRYLGRIIPALLLPRDFEKLSWTLGGIQQIDFTRRFRDGCRELLRLWAIGFRGKPLPARSKGRE